MKKIILSLCILTTSLTAFAVPRGMYLASPKKIEVVGGKVKLTLSLNCKNESPDEWAGSLVAVSDDEGDMAVGLGVVLAKSSCEASAKARDYVLTFDLKQTGLSAADLKGGASLEPMELE